MEHSFPSRFEWGFLPAGERFVLCVAVFVATSSLVGLCLTYFVKPSPKLVSLWFVAAVVSPFVLWLAYGVFENNWRHSAGASPWLNASFGTVLTVSILGAFLADIRLAKSGQQPCLNRLTIRALKYSLCAGVLMSITWFLSPTPNEARPPARRAQCKNNLKQIAVALHNYHKVYGTFPAAQISTPPISWRVQTLPFIDQKDLWLEYVPESPWDSKANEPIAKTQVSAFKCPSREFYADDKDARARFYTDYTMLTGEQAFSGHNKSTRIRDIFDGTSNTLAVVEATGLNIVWTEPRDADTALQPHAVNYSGNGRHDSEGIASSLHGPGAHALFADGEIRFLSEKINPLVLRALTTTAGEEDIPWSEVEKR